MRRFLGVIGLSSVSAGAVLGVCLWTSSVFSGVGGCTNDWCGVGCTVEEYGVDQGICYTSMDACCYCAYRIDTCDCWFGEGSARMTARYEVAGSNCNLEPGTQCGGWTAPSLPTW